MKKNLQRFVCLVVLFFPLLGSASGSAGNIDFSAGKNNIQPHQGNFKRILKSGSGQTATKPAQVTHIDLLFTAPPDLQLNTDPWLSIATEVKLGTPVMPANRGDYTFTNDAPPVFPIGTTNVVWTATDANGNSGTAIQKVTVTDNEKPFIYKRGEISVVNDPGQCGAVVQLMTPDYYDNSGRVVTFSNDAPAYFPVGSVTITWTATDMFGNSDTSTQLITVIDNEEPVISTNDITVNATPGKCGATVNLGAPVTSDNCGVVSVTNDAPSFFPVGTTLVHWTVTDKVGYTGNCTQTVVVKDVSAPVFTGVPANVTVSCSGIPAAANPAVTDPCGSAVTVTLAEVSTKGTDANKAAYYNYSITRTWTATDASGNTATAKQVITVTDNTAPVITVPASINVSNDANVCGATVVYSVSASDNCNSPVTITYSKNSNTLFATGSTVVTVTAKDITGNISTKTFTVTVTDTQKPTVKAPANVSVSTSNNSVSNVNLGTPVTSDNCAVKTVTNNAPSSYPVGITTVTWTVKDANNNTTTATQTVTVTSTKKKSGETIGAQMLSARGEKILEDEPLTITVAPNPTTTYFTLTIAGRTNTPVNLRVLDISGRVVDSKTKLAVGSTVQVGHNFMPGAYFAEFTQGTERKIIQLIKIR